MKDYYVVILPTNVSTSVRSLEPFSDKPPVPELSFPQGSGGVVRRASPNGERLAVFVIHPGAGVGPAVGDLYVWSKREGKKLLAVSTPKQPFLWESSPAWTADSRWLLVHGYANDCTSMPIDGTPKLIRRCNRLLLLDPDSGRVAYRTPASLDPRSTYADRDRVLIKTYSLASTNEYLETYSVSGTSKAPRFANWELDIATLQLRELPSRAHTSPDGRFRISVSDNEHTQLVEATDGTSQYELSASLFGVPRWSGAHTLELWFDDVELDLESRVVRRLAPSGFFVLAHAPDGSSAILTNRERPPTYAWAKRR